MLVLGLLMMLILVIAGAVVLYVAYPHRGEEVPGAPWIGEAMKRGVDTVGDLLERPADQGSHAAEREHADH
jgi:hypothetical protein